MTISPHQDAWLVVSIALSLHRSEPKTTKSVEGDARAYRKVLAEMISSYQHARAHECCAKDMLTQVRHETAKRFVRESIPTFDGQSFSIINHRAATRDAPEKSPFWTAIRDNMTCILI